jgi:hypothetical protein
MWTVELLNASVEAELDALPDDMLARFWHIVDLIEEVGLEQVRGPHVDACGRSGAKAVRASRGPCTSREKVGGS